MHAPLVELVDTLDLGSSAARFESSSLSGGTQTRVAEATHVATCR